MFLMNTRVQSVGYNLFWSLLMVFKRLIGLWEPGSESGLPGSRLGITLADFQA